MSHLQVITRKASSRVAEFAFKYAKENQRCVGGMQSEGDSTTTNQHASSCR
jgi:isocitrate/isopropylmalate dehydrogenase